jgi:hypothetical protein
MQSLCNPYYDEAVAYTSPPGRSSFAGPMTGLYQRESLRQNYAFSVPRRRAIEVLVELSPVVEIGAGTGYWARLVDSMGGDIVAYDDCSRDDVVHGKFYQVIDRDGVDAVREHGDRSLFLCWPELGTSMARDTLEAYFEAGGDTLIFVGEYRGAVATDSFFDLLEDECEEASSLRVTLPKFFGIHDIFEVYVRDG